MKTPRIITRALRDELLVKSRRRCPMCFAFGDTAPKVGTLAHIEPVEKGETETLDNLVFLCREHHSELDQERKRGALASELKEARDRLYRAIENESVRSKTGRPEVFLIQGRNETLNQKVTAFLRDIGLEPISFSEQPNFGLAISEKIEQHGVNYVIAIISADDNDRRPRKNVVFELGYFLGRLGHRRICALVEPNANIPSDLQGLLYIRMDKGGSWADTLKREIAEAGLPIAVSQARTVKIPSKPVYRSDFDIAPAFRFDHLREYLFFIFVKMPALKQDQPATLLQLLQTYFVDTYSVYELFGEYDFLIRVWAPQHGEHVASFCQRLSRILDNENNCIRLMVCDQAVYLDSSGTGRQNPVRGVKVLSKLNEAQRDGNKASIDWLKRKGIYVRSRKESVKGPRVQCFTLLRTNEAHFESERKTKMALILQALQKPHLQRLTHFLSFYQKAPPQQFPQVGPYVLEEPSDCLISYVVDRFEDAAKIPILLFDKIFDPTIRSSTLLATERFVVSSDRVLPSWSAVPAGDASLG